MIATMRRSVRSPFGGVDINDPSLVFYAPLWHPGLSMSPFLSRDLNRHSCTVYGATWGSQGRSFDGMDDRIHLASVSNLPVGSTARTIIAWIKLTDYATTNSFVRYGRESVPNGGMWGFYTEPTPYNTKLTLGTYGDDVYANTNVPLGSWQQGAASWAGGTSPVNFYLNAIPDGSPSFAGTINTASSAVNIGADLSLTVFLKGSIGEILLYNRALTASEIQRNYLATKWRYQ